MTAVERDLIVRLLTALLREDVGQLRSRGRVRFRAGRHSWLTVGRLRLPVRPASAETGDQIGDLAVYAPILVLVHPGRRVVARRLRAVVTMLRRELPDTLDADRAAELRCGLGHLGTEAGAALTAAGLRRRARPKVLGRLRPELTGSQMLGWSGALGYETLAAHRDHPLYPLSAAKVGLPAGRLMAVAPEHRPEFDLGWLTLPVAAVEARGRLPTWWPDVGADGVVMPVHPAVPRDALVAALAGIGLDPEAVLATGHDHAATGARPTLALRTVVTGHDRALHLKLPVPMRTLGRLNLRTLARPSLADGALVGDLVRRILAAGTLGPAALPGEPGYADLVTVADESTWLHAGHPLLAVLLRRWPDFSTAAVVPVAGLAAIGPDGRPVIETLAHRFAGGDLDLLLEHYLRLLIGWHAGLWLRHGLVLEAHPQNVLVALDRPGGHLRVRLLLRDLDSAKLDLDAVATGLPGPVPARADLADPRLSAGAPRELLDLFVTTTVHQCVAAVLIDVAVATGTPVRPRLDRVGELLREAAGRHCESAAATTLVADVVDAARLPVKRALTAATLLPKTRTGATDVNKYYGADAPSYLGVSR